VSRSGRSGGRRLGGWSARIGYALLLVLCTGLSVAGLVVGAVVAAAAQLPAATAELRAAAEGGSRWSAAMLAAVPTSEPAAQLVLDYGFSLLSTGLAVALLVLRERTWSILLFALAMMGSAGAFNLQAHAAATAVEAASGLSIGALHQVLLPGVACAAYILALTVFPTAGNPSRAGLARTALLAVAAGTLLLVGSGTTLLPQAASCVLFFGFLVPVAGLLALPGNVRHAPLAEQRTQSRLLFSVLAGAFAVAVVLAVVTAVLWSVGWTGLNLFDPTASGGGAGQGQPIALLFWFARLACIAIAGAVLVATLRSGSWTVEHLFSRGLVAALVGSMVAGGHIVLRTLGEFVIDPSTGGGAAALAAVSTVPVALAFLPLYVRAERAVDRLLYGTRPTPYSVLAGIAALSRGTSTDGPDLARVAEAVGRGVGATACRLTVLRPGLRDRVYSWSKPGVGSDPVVEVAVWHGSEQIGSIAVDQGAVAGLHGQRRHLLEDIADSLGAVFQASRAGIELERQLRAALAYAGGIAVSRRAVVAEMDWERRRIERDLHDGAQHHLVSLRLALGLVEHQVSTGQLDQARSRLEQITVQIDVAEAILAETAKGVSSPLLAELGLVRALRKELGSGHPPVVVDAHGVDEELRIPSDVEAAVYFCCLEAVNNARKHAPGAAIAVQLATAEGRLRFVVRDEGPGWDTAATGSAGRGMRNLTARIGTVGGRLEVRSAPGSGTTVEGSAPLPAPPGEPAEVAAERPGFRPGATPVLTGSLPLPDQVRDALRAARELYHGSGKADALRELAERLEEPLRVAVSGPPGAGTTTLVEALRAAMERDRHESNGSTPTIRLIDTSGSGSTAATQKILVHAAGRSAVADASVVLLRHRRVEDVPAARPIQHSPALTVGVLARVDELGAVGPTGEGMELAERAATEWATRPEVRRRCPVVVPVAGLLAQAAAHLTEEQYQALRRLDEQPAAPLAAVPAGPPDAAAPVRPSPTKRPQAAVPVTDVAAEQELLDRFGPAGVRLATDLIRSGRAPTPAALAVELTRHSGLPRLLELIETRLGRRAAGVKARSALRALEALVRSEPPPTGAEGLRYRFDRIRSGTHELAELDLVDRLRSGELDLTDDQRASAERLLGAMGTEPRVRLALAADAGSQEIAMVASEQLAHWQRLATHPVSGKDVRDVAAVVIQSCEQLFTGLGH
jgi:signal transduction histidine kinase